MPPVKTSRPPNRRRPEKTCANLARNEREITEKSARKKRKNHPLAPYIFNNNNALSSLKI
jgi:hypothetical protein